MTISTQSSQITVAGTGVATSFNFPFVADQASDISVTLINASNVQTLLSPTQYTLTINNPAVNQLWGYGGTVTYPLTGSPIPVGSFLLIERALPLTQSISIQNQGNFYPQVTEQALDILEMQIQQLSSRTTQFRGIWTTDTVYNYGDIVQDGSNGLYTNNYYICVIPNTSDIWANDLAAGDWAISVYATIPVSPNQEYIWCGNAGGTGSAITLSSPIALQTGQVLGFVASVQNTGQATISVNGGSAIGLYISTSNRTPQPVIGEEISPYQFVLVGYVGGLFQLLSISSSPFYQGFPTLTGSPGTTRFWGFATNELLRWAIGAGSDTESGSNTGSSYALARYADNGVYIDTPFAVSRATGVAGFEYTPTFPTVASNTSNTQGATTAFANPGSLLAQNGYTVYPDGTVDIQGASAPIASASSAVITMPISVTTLYGVEITTVNIDTGAGTTNSGAGSYTTSGFTIFNRQNNTATFVYRAKGKL